MKTKGKKHVSVELTLPLKDKALTVFWRNRNVMECGFEVSIYHDCSLTHLHDHVDSALEGFICDVTIFLWDSIINGVA